jgi:hypothetical protein
MIGDVPIKRVFQHNRPLAVLQNRLGGRTESFKKRTSAEDVNCN